MSKHLIKSNFTAEQMLSLIDVTGASIVHALVSISTNPAIVALADEAENSKNKTLKKHYISILVALDNAAKGLQCLKVVRNDLIKTVEAARDESNPLPELDQAALDRLFADIQADGAQTVSENGCDDENCA